MQRIQQMATTRIFGMPRKQTKPPIKLRKLYAPLIELCRNKILTAPSQTSGTGAGDALITINIRWPVREGRSGRMLPDLPEGFPEGTVLERGPDSILIRHNVYRVLDWMKANAYCNFNAADLFAMRLPVLMRLAKLELKLDRMLEGVDVDVEQQAQELLDEP